MKINAVKFKDKKSFDKNKNKPNVRAVHEPFGIIVFEDVAPVAPDSTKVSQAYQVDAAQDNIPTGLAILVAPDFGAAEAYLQSMKVEIKETYPLTNTLFVEVPAFAVFDENELDTRFIKASIKRYINKEPIQIHQDKYMSFFYMEDLVKVVEYYILNDNAQKELDCCYSHIYTLSAIADIINKLDSHQVDVIKHTSGLGNGYYGNNLTRPNIDYIGLENSIKEVYNKLK